MFCGVLGITEAERQQDTCRADVNLTRGEKIETPKCGGTNAT